jgi:selenocysteine lyase/cysteine desulfurase
MPGEDPLLQLRPEFLPLHALEVSREPSVRDIVGDYRADIGIRMSPHFYAEDGELDRAFEAIDEILRTGSWKRWECRGGPVT